MLIKGRAPYSIVYQRRGDERNPPNARESGTGCFMKIIHLCSHAGGGVGTVLKGWLQKDNINTHQVFSLENMEDKRLFQGFSSVYENAQPVFIYDAIKEVDIVVVHFWDRPILLQFLTRPLPSCRLIFWSHKNWNVPDKWIFFPDMFIDTSPIQSHKQYIWSTGDISRFLEIKPIHHQGFNIGYIGTVDYTKIYRHFIRLFNSIKIPDVKFTIIGKNNTEHRSSGSIKFLGQVDDVAPYLAEMDLFFYPLRRDHYGTCEQSLGEAMAAGIPPVMIENPAESFIFYQGCYEEEKITSIVELLGQDGSLRKYAAIEAKIRARELYSIDNMIAEWDSVFDDMMQKEKRTHEYKG